MLNDVVQVSLSAGQVLQLFVPAVSSIFALSFLCAWAYDRKRPYLPLLAEAFATYAVGRTLQILLWPADAALNTLLSTAFYLIAVLTLVEGMSGRSGLRPRWTAHTAITALLGVSTYYFCYVAPSTVGRVGTLNFCLGLALLLATLHMRKLRRGRAIDRALFWVLATFAAIFFLRTVAAVGQDSALWLVLHFVVALCGVLLGLVLIAATMGDVVEGLIVERDHDPLTGLMNRRAFETQLKRLVDDRRYHPLTVIVCDIDHFKSINDNFGHSAGDAVLREFGHILRGVVREHDIVARIGGEEFVVLLPNTDARVAHDVAERLRTTLMRARFEGLSSAAAITVTSGVAERRCSESSVALLARADDLLYSAKRAGRNRIFVDSSLA